MKWVIEEGSRNSTNGRLVFSFSLRTASYTKTRPRDKDVRRYKCSALVSILRLFLMLLPETLQNGNVVIVSSNLCSLELVGFI